MQTNYSYLSDGTKASVLNASRKEGYDSTFGIALDDFGARLYDRTAWTSIDPLAEKHYSLSPYAYCAGNPVAVIDDGGKDLIIVGVNNSSVSFKTNLIDLSVNIGKLGVDWKGNYSFEGDELLGAAISAIGLIPYAGELAKQRALAKMSKR